MDTNYKATAFTLFMCRLEKVLSSRSTSQAVKRSGGSTYLPTFNLFVWLVTVADLFEKNTAGWKLISQTSRIFILSYIFASVLTFGTLRPSLAACQSPSAKNVVCRKEREAVGAAKEEVLKQTPTPGRASSCGSWLPRPSPPCDWERLQHCRGARSPELQASVIRELVHGGGPEINS
jgi:hypothetical protein